MKLSTRIFLTSFSLGLIILIVGLCSIWSFNKNYYLVNNLTYKELPSISENSKMNGIAKDMRSFILRLNLKTTTEADVEKIENRFKELRAAYQASSMEYEATKITDPEEKKLYQEMSEYYKVWIATSNKLIELKKINFNSEDFNEILISEYKSQANDYLKKSNEFIDYLNSRSKKSVSIYEELHHKTKNLLIAITLIGLLVSIISSFTLAKGTEKQLVIFYNVFKNKFDRLLKNGNDGIDKANSNLNRVEAQAQALVESSSAAQETFRTVEGVALQTERLKDETRKNVTHLNEGLTSLNELDLVMGNVNSISAKLESRVRVTEQELGKIVEIFKDIEIKTNSINDIVFQTKLLSFNASVEAARAGENGKGFAVVASEIGELAKKSGESSKDIFEIIASSQTKISEITKQLESEIGNVVDELKFAVENSINATRKVFLKIESSVELNNSNSTLVEEISRSSNEQAAAVGEITNAINHLQDINRQNEDCSLKTLEVLNEINKSALEMENEIRKLVYGK